MALKKEGALRRRSPTAEPARRGPCGCEGGIEEDKSPDWPRHFHRGLIGRRTPYQRGTGSFLPTDGAYRAYDGQNTSGAANLQTSIPDAAGHLPPTAIAATQNSLLRRVAPG